MSVTMGHRFQPRHDNPPTCGYLEGDPHSGPGQSACGLPREQHVGEPAGTLDLTPSWVAVARIYLELLDEIPRGYEDKDKKRADMKAEIMRAAALADLYVKEHKR